MKLPDFSFEKEVWEKGYRYIIGTDEVGRGAFAGPLVAGATALRLTSYREEILKLKINDSKKLGRKVREEMDKKIRELFYCALGIADVPFINKFGIVKATEYALRQAVLKILFMIAGDTDGSRASVGRIEIEKLKPYVFLDAFHVRYIPIVGLKNQKAIVKGDMKSISIAAASVVAKVYRDSIMRKLHKDYTHYGWDSNVGYGTKKHQDGIKKYGLCRLHRKSFVDHLFI